MLPIYWCVGIVGFRFLNVSRDKLTGSATNIFWNTDICSLTSRQLAASTMEDTGVKVEMKTETIENLSNIQVQDSSDGKRNHMQENSLPQPYTAEASFFQSRDVQDKLTEVQEQTSDVDNKKKTQMTSKRAFKCDMCDKQYQQSGHLKRHKLTHIGLKPYGCDLCSKTFADSSTLKKHRVIHTEERPFTCEICEKAFSFNSTLKTHMRIHTGEKPYSCDICNRGFSDSSNLRDHLNVHRGKVHNCEVCNRGFSKISYLKMHMLKHNGPRLDCDLCHKGFSYYGSLKRHIQRIHIARQPVSCKICQKDIPDINAFQEHMRTHAGEIVEAHLTSAP